VKAVIRPRAQDDILRQFRWYLVDQDAPDAAFRFVEAVEASVEQLLRMPNMGAPRELRNPALKGLRLWPVNDTVRVIRILHGKRDVDRILKKESGDNASRTRNNRDRPPSCLTHVLGAASLGGFEVIIDGPF
jgi:plasmid stabilization system protein ParE